MTGAPIEDRRRRREARRRRPPAAASGAESADTDFASTYGVGCMSVGGGVILLAHLAALDVRLLFLAVLVATFLGTLRLRRSPERPGLAARRSPRDRLRSLAMHLPQGHLDEDDPERVTVHGRARGREVSLVVPRAALEAAGQAVTLRAPVACSFEARIAPNPGTGALTARVTTADQVELAEARLRRPDVMRDLAALVSDHDVERVVVRGGVLLVTARLWRVVPARLERALDRLASIARALERDAPDGIALPVMVPRAGAARCPYCRDPLAAGGAVVACGRCGTRLHADCWGELGRCSAAGCAGETSAPVADEDAGITLGLLPCATCGSREPSCTSAVCLEAPRRGWRQRPARPAQAS
jgi:hypothetical protein